MVVRLQSEDNTSRPPASQPAEQSSTNRDPPLLIGKHLRANAS